VPLSVAKWHWVARVNRARPVVALIAYRGSNLKLRFKPQQSGALMNVLAPTFFTIHQNPYKQGIIPSDKIKNGNFTAQVKTEP
jgi:hypothetical protein